MVLDDEDVTGWVLDREGALWWNGPRAPVAGEPVRGVGAYQSGATVPSLKVMVEAEFFATRMDVRNGLTEGS
jgi:hypothetical protein